MLHDRHELKRVVAQIFNARQNFARELIERANFSFLLRHSDVRFVDSQTASTAEPWALVRPTKLLRGHPKLSGEAFILLLNRSTDVRRNAVHRAVFADH